jgi:hypothetical protein
METRSRKHELEQAKILDNKMKRQRARQERELAEALTVTMETRSRKRGRERLEHERVKAKMLDDMMALQAEDMSLEIAKAMHFDTAEDFKNYWKKFDILRNNRIVFEEHGKDLQKHGVTVHTLVREQTSVIKKALDEYAVSMGDLASMRLSVFSGEVLSGWNEFMVFRKQDWAGPHYILEVMLLEYLERLQGTYFVPADRFVKPGTVMVLLMLAIRYNDDQAVWKSIFNEMIRSVKSIADLTLDEIGMKYSEPPLKEDRLGNPIPREVSVAAEFLDADVKKDDAYLLIKSRQGETQASVICVNAKRFKNVHKYLTLVALNALEVKMLQALDWRLGYVAKPGEIRSDGITPKKGEEESPHWNLTWHDADEKHWFWKRLAQIRDTYPDEKGAQSEKKV